MVTSVKHKLKNIIGYSLLSLLFSLVGLALTGNGVNAANNGTLSLTPANGTFTVGDYVTLKITENSGTTEVNAVEADLKYDKSVLQFVSIDATQSAFGIAGPMVGGGGVVQIARAADGSLNPPSKNGAQTVASVTFKVIGSAANTIISFDTTSQIKTYTDHLDIWNHVTTGASFALKAAPVNNPPTNPGGGSTTGGGSSSSSGGKPSAPPRKTSGSASTPVAAATPPATTSTQPTETTGEESEPEVLTPTTSFVAVKVVDDEGKPVAGASVKLDGQTVKTDSQGVASFTSVTKGQHTVTVSYSGQTQTRSLEVKQADSNSGVQQFQVKLAAKKALPTWVIYTIIGLIVLFILGFFIPRRKPKVGDFASDNFTGGAVVVGGASAPTPAPVAPTPPPAPKPVPKPAGKVEPTPPGTIITSDQENKSNKEQAS